MRIKKIVRLRTHTPALGEPGNTPLRAVVAAHTASADAPAAEGASPAVAASAPLIGATAFASTPLASAPILRMLMPVVRAAVVVSYEAGMGLAGPSKAAARSARRALSTKEALVAVAAVEIHFRQEVGSKVVGQVDARRG